MKKNKITSELKTLNYNGKDYEVKLLTNANGDTDYLATEELCNALGEDADKWGAEERMVDEQICFYATEEQFNSSDEEIAEMLNEAGCMIAE